MPSLAHRIAVGNTLDIGGRPGKPLTAFVALGIGAVALAALSVSEAPSAAAAVRLVGVALPIGFGLLRLARAEEDRFAGLLVIAGAMWSLTTLAESGNAALYSVGRTSVWLVEPVLVFLILAFPHGRIETQSARRLFAAVVVLVATLFIPAALLAPFPEPSPWGSCGTACPANALQLTTSAPGLVDGFMRPVRELLAVALFACVTALVVRRSLRASVILRRILVPVAVVAGLRAIALSAYFATRDSGGVPHATAALGWVYVLSLPIITLAFAAGLLAHRLFVAGALERLTGRLASRPRAAELRDTLASALRDDRLQIRFPVEESPSGWVDQTGWPVNAPRAAGTRGVTEVHAGRRVLAAIVHDSELSYEPALLNGVTSYALTALENRQLVARLRASLEELTTSRARLVSVADEERRKIERDLHDGAQQRLVALQIKLELLAEQLDGESVDGARRARAVEREIGETLDEVRRFARGVYPPLLADRGLSDALHAAARSAPIPTTVDARLPHRYPRDMESAVYFVCLEALQNVAKHAHGATSATISVTGNGNLHFEVRDNGVGFDSDSTRHGAGLTHMFDRIGALDGELEISSRPGKGTRVTGTVPFA